MGILTLLLGLVILLYSAILHEIAHGYVAERLGDPTARLMGRLTLDPRKHIDPFMSIILPLMLIISGSPIIFGGAKPVPVDPFNLREGRKDMALVSLAGPATNALLAICAALLIHLFTPHYTYIDFVSRGIQTTSDIIPTILYLILQMNILLAIFNMLPLPPLDGSKVFSLLLPEREAAAFLSLGQFGIIILLLLLAFPIGGFSLEGLIYNLFTLARGLLGI